jgi:hypothetical protein
MGTRIFISHSRKDEHVAKALVDAIETGIAIPSEEIRCTSVAGYDLAPGDDAPEVLRRNLRECSIVLALLTANSLESRYVLMELGAAWVLRKRAIPLIGPGASFDDQPGFFRDLHPVDLQKQPALDRMIREIADETGLGQKSNPAKHRAAVEDLVREAGREVSSVPPHRTPEPPRPPPPDPVHDLGNLLDFGARILTTTLQTATRVIARPAARPDPTSGGNDPHEGSKR